MEVILAALGGGTPNTLTAECLAALQSAGKVIGARRLLQTLPEGITWERIPAVKPQEILEAISGTESTCVVVYSGDTGFYSGTRSLLPLLQERGIPFRVLPGISSVQLLSARLLRPWQDWNLVSAHGTHCPVAAEVTKGKPSFFLTGGKDTGVQALCTRLTQAGLGDLPITVGEQLSYQEEKITRGTARELAEMSFHPLAVMLAEPAPTQPRRCPGYPDSAFTRGDVPMTKQEVRSAVLSKLAVSPGDILWDVGAGTGSVSVEMALAAPQGEVYAVECNQEGCALIAQNREKFAAWNLHIVEGRAPEALETLPSPDAVFLGGTKGAMEPILRCAVEKNPQVRISISAIALETLSQAIGALNTLGYRVEVSQIAVSRSKGVGKLHLLMANNPVFLITGEKDD